MNDPVIQIYYVLCHSNILCSIDIAFITILTLPQRILTIHVRWVLLCFEVLTIHDMITDWNETNKFGWIFKAFVSFIRHHRKVLRRRIEVERMPLDARNVFQQY